MSRRFIRRAPPFGFLSYVQSDDVHESGRLTRLRKRLEGTGASIQTVRGFGYMLDVETA